VKVLSKGNLETQKERSGLVCAMNCGGKRGHNSRVTALAFGEGSTSEGFSGGRSAIKRDRKLSCHLDPKKKKRELEKEFQEKGRMAQKD